MPLTGSCMCGSITYSADGKFYLTSHDHDFRAHYEGNFKGNLSKTFTVDTYLSALCHCLDCQKWTGGAFTSNAVVPRSSFKVTKGTPSTYDVTGASGKVNKHFFCQGCGSSLYTELEVMADNTVIKAGTLDNNAANLGGKIDIEFYVKDRASYLAPVEGAKQEPMFG
ncbi:hypothetical protein N7462_001976 [Penicillium macrosclerotiorum]|uniref:uncharacterized protein n=1 Tax=Penicillium macrosclerotiorum TaxID=303699 RepID=UPI0025465CFE|nr:uncharacterized protein N7462_001976 [Penicillium macrosclerotiorum]KAJ5692553.1 hypothetical protein N7462_001976 [Penicillium macrosclerotiorum]